MLSQRIRELRRLRSMSQVDLADRLGVTKQSISNWENDNILPSVDMLVKIADFFGVSTDYLLGKEKSDVLDVSDLPPEFVTHLRQLIEDYRKTL